MLNIIGSRTADGCVLKKAKQDAMAEIPPFAMLRGECGIAVETRRREDTLAQLAFASNPATADQLIQHSTPGFLAALRSLQELEAYDRA